MVVDNFGVEIVPGDTVTVIAWGAPVRLIDTGRRAKVAGLTARGNVILGAQDNDHDPIARGLSVRPGYLAVARRDGAMGHEGNLPQYARTFGQEV